MQSLRGELLRARATMSELIREPLLAEPAARILFLMKASALTARLQQAVLDSLARQIERMKP